MAVAIAVGAFHWLSRMYSGLGRVFSLFVSVLAEPYPAAAQIRSGLFDGQHAIHDRVSCKRWGKLT